MIKTEIQNLINVNLADSPLIVPEKHRDVESALLLNSYGSIITETQSTVGGITQSNDPLIKYSVNIIKQGRVVFLSGSVINSTGRIISNSLITDRVFKIVSPEYLPSNSAPFIISTTENGKVVTLNVIDKNFYVLALGANQSVSFNIYYFTNS